MNQIFEVLRNITCGILKSQVEANKKDFQIFPSEYLALKIDLDETKRQLIFDFDPRMGSKITVPGKTMFLGLFNNSPFYN